MTSFPSAAEVRSGMRRLAAAHSEVERLQKAQIAQSIFTARIDDRVTVSVALVAALGSLREAVDLYLALMGLTADEEYPPVLEEVQHG